MTKQTLSHYGIGASEIAAVAGLNPYASPWDVWLRKTGQCPEEEQNAPMEWGHRLEPAIRQKYVDDTKAVVHVPTESLFHPGRPWARATPDGIVLEDAERISLWKHLLQCKNVGAWVETAWHEAPPAYVQLQEQWELYVTGLARADVAVLIGGNDFRIYTIHRDDKMIGDLVAIAEEFWHRVENHVEPDIDESDACRRHFEKRLKKDAVELVADTEIESLVSTWRSLHLQAKDIDKKVDTIRNEVRRALAEAGASRLVSASGVAKLQARGGKATTDWKLVAQLVAAAVPREQYEEIVRANTTTTDESLTLVAPREWAKESA